MIYKIKCPSCNAKADAFMKVSGIKGTYREPTPNYVVEQIQCPNCGLIRKMSIDKKCDFEFWYKSEFKGKTIWAVNDEQLEFLINWLSSDMNKKALSLAERAFVEILPRWLVRNRRKILPKLEKLNFLDN